MDLLFNDSRKKKRKVISPLIITFNPGNPPIKRWIQEEIKVLHEDPTLKKIFPKIDVVTRQAENIGQSVIKCGSFPSLKTPTGHLPLHLGILNFTIKIVSLALELMMKKQNLPAQELEEPTRLHAIILVNPPM